MLAGEFGIYDVDFYQVWTKTVFSHTITSKVVRNSEGISEGILRLTWQGIGMPGLLRLSITMQTSEIGFFDLRRWELLLPHTTSSQPFCFCSLSLVGKL